MSKHACTIKHLLVVDLHGYICDFVLCAYGTIHDSRVARDMMANLTSREGNPHRLGLVGDTAWTGNLSDIEAVLARLQVAVMTPAQSGMFDPASVDFIKMISRWISCLRIHVEIANGAIQRAFPRWDKVTTIRDYASGATIDDFTTMVGLWNYRTNVLGLNPVQTSHLRHTSAWFAHALTRPVRGENSFTFYLDEVKQAYARAELLGCAPDAAYEDM